MSMRPQSLKEAVERIIAGEEERIPVAEFLDTFYLHYGQYGPTAELQAMLDVEPPLSDNSVLDAYVAGIAEHLVRRWGLATIPAWVEEKCRYLETQFFRDDGLDSDFMHSILLRDSPIAFRRRLIFTEAEPLRRGRFPQVTTRCLICSRQITFGGPGTGFGSGPPIIPFHYDGEVECAGSGHTIAEAFKLLDSLRDSAQ